MGFSKNKSKDTAAVFLDIIKNKNEKAILPFLKSLSTKQREVVRMEAIKIHDKDKAYLSNSSTIESDIFAYVHFFCFRKEDIEYIRIKWRDLPNFKEMEEILSKTIPKHFPDLYSAFLINGYLRKDIYGRSAVGYEDIMRWKRKGYVCSIEPYIAMRMDEIFPRSPKVEIKDAQQYILHRLEEYPEILDEQIYYLFKYPNEVSYADKLGRIKVGKVGAWSYLLKTFTRNGRLDRLFFLRECLIATNQDFKRDQLNWYIDLFEWMDPTTKEIIELQNVLFSSLKGVLTKRTAVCLSMIKQIAAKNSFRATDFLTKTSTPLASKTKAIVTSTLAVFEKIAAKKKELREKVCLRAVNAFISKDETIQTRTAKLILKYGDPDSEVIKKKLLSYTDKMLTSTKKLLAKYLVDKKKTDNVLQQVSSDEILTPKHINNSNRIKTVSSTKELIFELTRVFSYFEPADFYLVPDALFRLQQDITEDTIVQASPIIQKAYKIVTTFNPGRSFHLNLLAYFFLKYCQYQFTVLPEGNEELQKLRDTYNPLFQYVDRWFNEPATGDSYTAWEGFKHLTLYFLEKFSNYTDFPILCIPTHQPTWIDPLILIKKLRKYQKAGIEPDTMDMQQALHLCSLENPDQVLPVIEKGLSGELKELFNWFFSMSVPRLTHIQHEEWWLTAAIANPHKKIPTKWLNSFNPILIPYLRNKFEWEPYIDTYTSHIDKNPETGKEIPVIRHNPRLRFNIERIYTQVVEDQNLFAAYIYTWYPWAANLMTNIKGIMLSTPNNWQTILAKIMWENIQYVSDTIGKQMIPVLEVYRQTLVKARDMDILYITLCLLQKDKTLRICAGEVWVEMTELNLIDNALLGRTIGRFEAIEYAPIKRFIEIIEDNMIGRSPLLNKQLEILTDECITQIGDKPITNLKKLQSIQKELKALNK